MKTNLRITLTQTSFTYPCTNDTTLACKGQDDCTHRLSVVRKKVLFRGSDKAFKARYPAQAQRAPHLSTEPDTTTHASAFGMGDGTIHISRWDTE